MEKISKVEILDSGQLTIALSSGGEPSFQHIYREAREVYWDNDLKAFKSSKPRDWTYPDWFNHIVEVAGECSIQLVLTAETTWVNVPAEVRNEMLGRMNT